MREFRILGPLEVVVDGQVVQLGGQRQRALVTALLVHHDHVVPTQRLVDLLWGEDAPRTATTSLQNSVSQLRRDLGADVIETRSPGYVLHVDGDALDAVRFERLLADARGAPPAERAGLLRGALGLWRGPALADVTGEEFAQGEIRRLEELRLAAFEERIAADIDLGRHADVVGELEALSREHPLRERVRELLMLALYRCGRQAEALQAYQDARATLVDELGIDPGAGLQELQRRILRQEAGLQPPGQGRASDDVEGEIAAALLAGRVVPVLGLAGAAELARRLATVFGYPPDDALELARVSQYAATMRGTGPLYDELHDLLRAAAEPEPVHRLLAALPPVLRRAGVPHQLIVTTNFDLGLERAFADAGEEVDVVAYVAAGPLRGRFWHSAPGGEPQAIELPNEYAELALERRTVLLKLRGAVDLHDTREWESFVVTEDDHIGYLGRDELAAAMPVTLTARLRRSHFLFAGFRMADWNLRLILNRLWGERVTRYASWAVDPEPTPLEEAFWRHHDVALLRVGLDDFARLLARRAGLERDA